jgi:hypothetical protein
MFILVDLVHYTPEALVCVGFFGMGRAAFGCVAMIVRVRITSLC